MTATGFEIVICRDAVEMAARVAGRIRDLAEQSGEERLAIALSGGSTPKRLYEMLGASPFRERVRWDRLELFFGDERAVPPDHQDSNYRMAREALLQHVPVTAHRMKAEFGQADAYEKLLRERIVKTRGGRPVFDLVLLGLGPDGHTASLFPATEALDEKQRLVVMNAVPQLKTRRMTLTYALLNAAERAWVLAGGADKRDIVQKCLDAREEAGAEKKWPVIGVRPEAGELVWWLDEASAGGR